MRMSQTRMQFPGVVTLEGRIGPLLKGDASQAHFIEMPGDLYCHEHSHPTESLIFTVKGRWVLVQRRSPPAHAARIALLV